MEIPFYQIDAFASKLFTGNPAGVCLLEDWIDDSTLQGIATENILPETAFLVPAGEEYDLRWFTPNMEVDLCGHATLASGFVIMNHVKKNIESVRFNTKSGQLSVERQNDLYVLDFPSRMPEPCDPPERLAEILGKTPEEILRSRDLMVVYKNESQIRDMKPNFMEMAELDCFAVIVTAPGDHNDFVSRFFAPGAGIPEDPVTGSAHCTLIPYWAERLGKKDLHAVQLSERRGELFCKDLGDRVSIAGKAVEYLVGKILL